MKIPPVHTLSRASQLSLLAVVILMGAIFFTVNSALQEQNSASHASTTTQTVKIGYTGIGTANDTYSDGTISTQQFTTPSNAVALSSVSVYIGSIQSGHNNYKVAIYSDTGSNRPKSLVAQSTQGTLAANAWNTIPLTTTLSANTKYWIAYINNGVSSPNTDNLQCVNSSGSYNYDYASLTYTNGFPATYSSSNTQQIGVGPCSMYVTGNITITVNNTPVPPTALPTARPTAAPAPTAVPTKAPTPVPTAKPTATPTPKPTAVPTPKPTTTTAPGLPTSTPAPTAKPTAIPTVVPTATPKPTATPAPTQIPQPTATPVPGNTTLSFTLALHGIGTGGDSANPTSLGNTSPLRTTRTITADVYNAQNQLVVSQQGTVSYDTVSGKFIGNIDLGTNFATGLYTVKVKTDQYLRALVSGIQTITTGKTNTLPAATLVAGDINGDNQINIVDYNILIGCYSDLLPATDCTASNNILADLNDDGHVNAFDYNLFLRELTNIGGQ